MPLQIILPIGTETIVSSEIPTLIAAVITPPDKASDVIVTAIRKRAAPLDMPYDEEMANELFPIEGLNDNDWKTLNFISEISDLQPITKGNALRDDISLIEWESYQKIFYENIKSWKYIPYSNTKLKIVENMYWEHLRDAIINNDVTVYDNFAHIPIKNPTKLTAFKKTYMTVSGFMQYAGQLNLKIVFNESKETSVNLVSLDSTNNPPPPCMINFNAINKLAVELAWQIERQNGGIKVKPKAVITKLREMVADENLKPSFLKGLSDHGVKWATTGHAESEYDIGACRATLYRWYKSRKVESKDKNKAVDT